MKTDYSIPPPCDLPPARLMARKQHLLAEIANEPTLRVALPRTARRPLRLVASALAVAATAIALLLVAPWQGGGGLTDRALAAVGNGQVLHVVTEQPSPYGWYQPVDLATGKPLPVTQRQEIWFDQSRDLKKTITTLNGTTLDELLETPQGSFTPGGPVYTCAWIAAHPVEATKARVSCNENMENGTTPRHLPEPPPSLDVALAGFVDHYRSALASGRATQIGTGDLDGHDVIWLRLEISGAQVGLAANEEVAIDASTYRPLLVRTPGPSPVEFKVVEIDTQAYDPALFTRPRPPRGQAPSIGEVVGKSAIKASQAPALLGGQALWLGREWNGYRLVGAERQDLTTGYGPLSGKPTHSVGVVFRYAPTSADNGTSTDSTLEIKEAAQCEMAWGMMCGRIEPPPDALLTGLAFDTSVLRRDGLYVAISQVAPRTDPVAVANALQPLSDTGSKK